MDLSGTWAAALADEALMRSFPDPELDDSGWEEVERASIAEHRWWSVAELAATAEVLHPPGLPRLLTDLLVGRLPATPVDVGRR